MTFDRLIWGKVGVCVLGGHLSIWDAFVARGILDSEGVLISCI